mgnify:CR=1 FL=1
MNLNKIQRHFIEEHMKKGALRNPFLIAEITKDFQIFFHTCNLYIKNKSEMKLANDIDACFHETWKEVRKKLKLVRKMEYVG